MSNITNNSNTLVTNEHVSTIKNVFFDLDGTLLGMDAKKFIYKYLDSLSNFLFRKGLNGEILAKDILYGFRAMQENDGSRTNEEMFWEYFHEKLGSTPVIDESLKDLTTDELSDFVRSIMTEFYDVFFEEIKVTTYIFDEVKEIIDLLHAKGIKLILTTNAVFPLSAQRKRLEWSAVDTQKFDYITSYETSKFCKPNTNFFKEIFDKFNLNPHETLLIGNDVEEDCCIEPLGSKVILLSENIQNRKNLDTAGKTIMTHSELLEYVKGL